MTTQSGAKKHIRNNDSVRKKPTHDLCLTSIDTVASYSYAGITLTEELYHSQRFDYQEMDLYWPVPNNETSEWVREDFARVAYVGHDVLRPRHQAV